jgi:hypothetical protein
MDAIEKAERIINSISKHLETENCQHCKTILNGVFEK